VTNTELLEQVIEKSGYKKQFLAEQIGLTPAGFRNCLTNKAEFKASQIITLCELLRITDPAQVETIFFDRNCALKAQN
jgi:hypothetical protein